MSGDFAATVRPPTAVIGGCFAILYVGAVLLVDTLAVMGADWPISWRMFQWRAPQVLDAFVWIGVPRNVAAFVKSDWLRSVDWFKLVFWLIVPFLLSVRTMDWGALGVARWKRIDWVLLLGLALLGLAAVFVIPYVEGLRDYYQSMSGISAARKWSIFAERMIWTGSWLLGWEFMHRYFLLDRASLAWPRRGWLCIPLAETAYHLQKHPLEAAGMCVFSIILTRWTIRRRNVLLPFLAHAVIEIELVAFQLFL